MHELLPGFAAQILAKVPVADQPAEQARYKYGCGIVARTLLTSFDADSVDRPFFVNCACWLVCDVVQPGRLEQVCHRCPASMDSATRRYVSI